MRKLIRSATFYVVTPDEDTEKSSFRPIIGHQGCKWDHQHFHAKTPLDYDIDNSSFRLIGQQSMSEQYFYAVTLDEDSN